MKHRRSLLTLGLLLTPQLALAAGTGGMPWETILARVAASLSGPVAQAVGVCSVVVFGLGLALSDGGGLRVILGILLGLSIAFGAAVIIAQFFGFTGVGGLTF